MDFQIIRTQFLTLVFPRSFAAKLWVAQKMKFSLLHKEHFPIQSDVTDELITLIEKDGLNVREHPT